MANLLDTIRANTNQASTQEQGVQDDTSRLASLLRAKQGKAVGSGSTVSSNLGEQSAVSAANQQMQNTVAPAVQIQNQAQKQQQNEQNQSNQILQAETSQARRADDVQTGLKTNQLLSDLQRSKGKVDAAQYKAGLEQLAQNLRLENKEYIDNLQREGQMARLDSDVGFKEALAEASYGDSRQLLETKLGNKSIIDTNDREFSKLLGQLDADTSYEIFKSDAKAQKNKAMWEGIAGIGQGGIGAYGSYQDKQDKKSAANSGSTK